MKAITIHQPWATLIALGEKRFETRSWATKYRGPLAIHAGKKVDRDACEAEPIRSVLAKHGYTADNLPTGVILAVGEMVDCLEVTGEGCGIVAMEGDAEPHFLPANSNEYLRQRKVCVGIG
ncbi:ASCH domain-containing protein [Brevibacillus thermoruber]|uniref:ASCH domain-containing protein n=1 Tax=Brevibacillus thermoruber TaxID=33942 RepID=UPI002F360A34